MPSPIVTTLLIVAGASLGLGACSGSHAARTESGTSRSSRADAAPKARRHFIEGSLFEMRERHRDAIAEYRRAIQLDSTMGAAYYAMGKSFRALRQNDSAIHYSEIALRLNPTEVRVREQLADLLVVAGELDRAIEQYERILESRPDDIAARYMAARLLQHRDPSRAIAHFEYMLSNLTDDLDVMMRLADLYMETGDDVGAVRVLRTMLTFDPANPDLHATIVETLLDGGLYSEAAAAVREAAEAIEDLENYERFLVDELRSTAERLRTRPGADSLRRFAQSLVARAGADGGSWRMRFHAGILSLRMGDSAQAESMITRAIADTASDEEAWLSAAAHLMNRHGAPMGLRTLGSAVTRHRGNGRIAYVYGILHELSGRDDSATTWLRWGIENVEELPESWEALGRLHARAGDTLASDAAYERAIALNPNNGVALNNYAYALARRGSRLEHALGLATQAVEGAPTNAAFLDTRGWLLFLLGRTDEALDVLRRADDLDPANAEILRHLSRAEAVAGNHAAARDALARAGALEEAGTREDGEGTITPEGDADAADAESSDSEAGATGAR